MTVSYWQQRHREKATVYDVLVVGGGIVGCATAYWLRRRDPSLRIAIVEAGTIGSGASGRNAGFVLQGTDRDYLSDVERYGAQTTRRLWHFTRQSRDLMATDLPGNAFGWAPRGSLTVAGTEAEDARLRACVPRMRLAGASVVYLEPSETNERLGSTGFLGSLYVTSGAVVDPLRLVRTLAAESEADVREQHPVHEIMWRDDGVRLDTPQRRLDAERVVLAVGPALPDLVPTLSGLVRPVRAQMLATAPVGGTRQIQVPAYSHDGAYYVRQLRSGAVLVGGGRHRHREAEDTGIDATTPAVQAAIERYLHTHFPWTQPVAVQDRWSGIMGFSPDGRPVVGRVPGHPQAVYATGFTGHGMGYGFHIGRLLADLTVGDDTPDALDLFTPARFEENRMVG